MQYLFTVILPVYQAKEYLEDCLDSLEKQCGSDVQILLVDDGSKDNSLDICYRYAAHNQRIQVFSQPNGGVAKARNTGLENAKGEYLLWVDPDDWVVPDWLVNIREVVESTHPDMLIFDYYESENERITERCYMNHSQSLPVSQVLTDLTADTCLRSVLWNKVIRKSFFDKQRFNESLRCMEDAELLCRIIPQMEKIVYLHKMLYVYRIRSTGLVQNPDLSSAFRCFELSKQREQAVRSFGIDASPLGAWLQAKGFLCKYYRLGSPQKWRSQYQQCKDYLTADKYRIMLHSELNIREKIKYLFIRYHTVGFGYRLLKKHQAKRAEGRG